MLESSTTRERQLVVQVTVSFRCRRVTVGVMIGGEPTLYGVQS
jgi:hypothetical protein